MRGLLALPQKIRQEDGTRDLFERVYQAIDNDDSKSITLTEFEAYFSSATERQPPSATPALSFCVSLAIAALGVAYTLLLLRHALDTLSAGESLPAAVASAAARDGAAAAATVAAMAKTAAVRVAAAAVTANSLTNSAANAAAAATVAAAAAAPAATTADAPAESSGAAAGRAADLPP